MEGDFQLQPATGLASLKEAEKEFRRLTADKSLLATAMESLDAWLAGSFYEDQRAAILDHLDQRQFPLLLDSFYRLLPFGTGGRRGRVGYGPNRINQITVAMSVQGHCNFLRQNCPASSSCKIVVTFDTRI